MSFKCPGPKSDGKNGKCNCTRFHVEVEGLKVIVKCERTAACGWQIETYLKQPIIDN